MPAPVIAAIIGAGASFGGAAISTRAANKAGQAQADASKYATDVEARTTEQAMQFAREQTAYDRWLQGATATARQPYMDALTKIVGQGGGGYTPMSYAEAKPFVAPTEAEAKAEPGYQFTFDEGQKALERSAASRGSLLTTGTLKDVQAFGQNLASTQYQKIYERRLGEYTMGEQLRAQAFGLNADQQYKAATMNADALARQQAAYLSLAGLATPDTSKYPGQIPPVTSLTPQPMGQPRTLRSLYA